MNWADFVVADDGGRDGKEHAGADVVVHGIGLQALSSGPLVTGIIGDARGFSTGLLVSPGVTALAVVPFAFVARREGQLAQLTQNL